MITHSKQRFIKPVVLISLVMLHPCFISIYAQGFKNLSFSTEFSSKFSVGQEIRGTILYEPGFTINYPKTSTYINPIYCFEFGPNYEVMQKFSIGVSGGIAVAQNERDPLTSNQYFNSVIFPLSLNFGYHSDIGKEFGFGPRFKIGYQFLSTQFGNTEEGFLYEQSGGLTMAIDLGLTKKIGIYSPFLSIGYELNRIQNDVSLGWIDGFDYDDKYQFSTSYHFIKLGIGIKY